MARADAEVDQAGRAHHAVPRIHVGRADLELECARHAVARGVAIAVVADGVPVEIDEARTDDQPLGLDRVAAGQRRHADRGDAITADADVTDGIKAGFRVDDPPSGNHQVEIRRLGGDTRHEGKGQQGGACESVDHHAMLRRGARSA